MNKNDVLVASCCDHNYLWKCKNEKKYGQKCSGPCELMTVRGTPAKIETDEKKV